MAAFLNQLFHLSALWHNQAQLLNDGDEQVPDDKTMRNSEACQKRTFPNSSIRWCSKSTNGEGFAALQ